MIIPCLFQGTTGRPAPRGSLKSCVASSSSAADQREAETFVFYLLFGFSCCFIGLWCSCGR